MEEDVKIMPTAYQQTKVHGDAVGIIRPANSIPNNPQAKASSVIGGEDSQVKKWLKKIDEIKKGEVDLSRDEDLSIALMNLVSLEEHFYFTAMKTNDQKYLEMLNSVRNLRKTMLQKIVKNPQGEEWCISKHLLASSMRLMEVGMKELAKENMKEANLFFSSAFNLYSLFFAINLKMVNAQNLEMPASEKETGNGLMQKFLQVVKKIVDCCKE